MKRVLLLVLLAVCAGIGAVLGFYNAAPVPFDYLFGQREWPLIALLAVSFAMGVLAAALLLGWRIVALRLSQRRLQRQLQQTETELRNLRNLPLTGESQSSH